ncbi:MAG TPA: hypothetical protein PKW35_17890 [Nannocystaceae bacterium]|nr:hypothetical protein [Nannocystaceae bacterium]
MRITTAILPALLLVLAAANCKGDEPVPSEFGEPCEPHGCAEGLECYVGYCEETCDNSGDCSTIDGWVRECDAGLCHILCDNEGACPQTLATPLACGVGWCAAKDG